MPMKLFACLAAIFLMISCSKNETSSRSCNLSRTNMIGTYKLSKAYLVNPNGSETDVTGGACYKSCELDDTYQFRSDSLILRDNSLRCSSTENYGSTTWTLVGDTLKIASDWNTITRDNSSPYYSSGYINYFSCDSFSIILFKDKCPSMYTKYRAVYVRQ